MTGQLEPHNDPPAVTLEPAPAATIRIHHSGHVEIVIHTDPTLDELGHRLMTIPKLLRTTATTIERLRS